MNLSTRPRRVLIVDDEESILKFASRALQTGRYETFVAGNGPDALRLAVEHAPIDLLLADVLMPDMRGDEVANLLRKDDPTLEVIYLTGHIHELYKMRPVLSANEVVLEKPCTIKVLLESVSLRLFGHPRGPAM